jgi:hypothetical protein
MTLFFLTFSTSAAGRAALTSAGACDGTAGGGLARTPSRAALEPTHLGGGPQGGFPLLPLSVTQKERRRPLLAGHVATSTWAPNPVAPRLLCPWVALTGAFIQDEPPAGSLSYGPPWAHYLGGYQDRLLGGPLELPDLRCTVPDGVKHKDYRGDVLG